MKTARFERVFFDISIVTLLICLFVPLLLVAVFCSIDSMSQREQHSAEVAVGLAVIVRAAARRFLRAGVQNLLRTSVGTFVRASTRTMTRRLVRLSLGLITKQALEQDEAETDDSATPRSSPTRSLVAAAIGYVALCLSFWGVNVLVGPGVASPIGSLDLATASLIAGVPILVYTLFMFGAARWTGLNLHIETQLDGLLIQGYFTGAGSFLPMTTDFEYDGTTKQRSQQACICLLGLYACHLILLLLGTTLDLEWMRFTAAIFLVYCFVYAFPIKPIQGHDIWVSSKLLWLAIFVPILISFLLALPENMAYIL